MKDKVNLLFFIQGLNFGGQQSYMYNILKCCDKLNIHTAYISTGGMEEKFLDLSVKLHQINSQYKNPKDVILRPFLLFRMMRQLYKVVEENKIEIISANTFITYMLACLVKIFCKVKVIRVIGGDLIRNEAFHYVKTFHLFPLHKLTDKFISWKVMLDLQKAKGVPDEKLVYEFGGNAVDYKHFFPLHKEEIATLRHQNNIDSSNIIISWVGRIDPDKELFHTLEALNILKLKGFDKFQFLIIGDGQTMPILKQKLKEYNLLSHTFFLGKQPYGELNKYYALTDIEILLDNDPQGGSHLREAMSCGKVIITTDGSSGFQRSWIDNRKTGLLVSFDNMYEETANLILELYNNKNLQEEIGKAGREYVEKSMNFEHLAYIYQKTCIELIS